jgi:hypothetical protein
MLYFKESVVEVWWKFGGSLVEVLVEVWWKFGGSLVEVLVEVSRPEKNMNRKFG